jgi:hypothetical protein
MAHARRRSHSAPPSTAGAVLQTYDAAKRATRYRQIRYGLVTHGFRCYIQGPDFAHNVLPIPNVDMVCGKRSWDAWVRFWRRALHCYDSVVFLGFPTLVQYSQIPWNAVDVRPYRNPAVHDDEAGPMGNKLHGTPQKKPPSRHHGHKRNLRRHRRTTHHAAHSVVLVGS